ncbi:transporter [Rhodococcus sp. SRB_17]|nr:transporter [Acidovorax sp. SRB_24]NMM89203.1 transporter [Rhodococcus sp. SRB_17]
MSIRQLILLSAVACALPGWAQNSAQPPSPQLTLAQALAAARDNSDVAQARHALAAARADVLSADHAPAPVLSAKAASIDLQNGIGGGSLVARKRIDKSIGIDWTWERGGKRALRTQAAQRHADAAQADVEDVQTQQLQAALSAYYDLLAAQERLRETAEIERSASALARLAARRVQAGDLSVQDAARTSIEAERVRAETQTAALERQQAALALAQITASAAAVEAAGTDWPALPATPDSAFDLNAAAEARADVRAALARVQAAQAARDHASAQRKSDWTVGASYDHFPGTSNRLVELRVSVPLQWGYHYEGEIARAQAEYAQAQDALDKTRRLAVLDLQHLQQAAAGAAQRAASFDNGILPRARQVAQSAELAYAKGATPLTDLLDARRTLRATALEALAARLEHAKALGAWQLRTRPQALLATP